MLGPQGMIWGKKRTNIFQGRAVRMGDMGRDVGGALQCAESNFDKPQIIGFLPSSMSGGELA